MAREFAGGMFAGDPPESARIAGDVADEDRGDLAGSGPGGGVVGRREQQDMRRLIEIRRAETIFMGRIEGAACGFVRGDRTHVGFDHGSHQSLVFGLVPARRDLTRQRGEVKPSRLLQEQGPDRQRPRRRPPSEARLAWRRGVVLRLGGDEGRGDHLAVHLDLGLERRPHAFSHGRSGAGGEIRRRVRTIW